MRLRASRWWSTGLSLTVLATLAAFGQDDADSEREAKVVDRFVGLLEKTPKRGTALDRVYGYHVERGTLDQLTARYREKTAQDPKDGASWMVLGLIEAQRGRDASAVTAFSEAEKTRPDDALASFYLGQTLVLVGRPDAAVDAFERALARKPARADSMEMYQALGRVHQRARRDAEALKVWERLEKQFPEDARVAEQIALTLAEEGQSALALPRYEKLAAAARDPYRKVQYKMEVADLKVRLGKKTDAVADFEGLLANLNPESWLHKEVRRKVEEVFLRNDDQNGLATYYEGWIKKHPDDIDAIARRARVLASLGRAPEAREALTAAVKLAPSRKELRLALVEQLVAEKKFGEAAGQYEEMAKTDPGNPDTIRDWGRLILRDPARPEVERKQAAATVWRKLLEARPKDAGVAAQVAELFRKAELNDEALSLYRKAVGLAPDAPQFREYLGENLHSQKRGEEALTAWSAMAEGPNRTAPNLARLAEVLSGFGYRKEAEKVAAEAVGMDPKSFEPRIKHADLLAQLERYDEALAELDAAEPLADDPEQREAVLTARIKDLQAGGKLGAMIETLKGELNAGKEATSERYLKLARYDEAAQRLPDALAAIRKAIELEPKSVPAHVAAARFEESSGNLGAAADLFRKLAAIDRRARTEHLTAIARLEARLGRRDEALKAGRELLAAAPNNPEHYQAFAELCFGLGESEEGLKALRRAARLNEADPKAALTLGDALAGQFRTEEAIEIYWRAFDKTPALDAKVGIVAKLANLYLQQNQFDRLTARIERAFQEGDVQQQPREKAACLAQAYTSAGDYMAARQQLESLLAANSRDTQLLQQLSNLAETEGDFNSAARYQKQINDVAPGFDGTTRLATLYTKAGETTEAENVWMAVANDEAEVHRVLQAIDSLIAAGKHETVLSITEKLLRKDPANWDLLYREAFALQQAERLKESSQRFRDLLSLRVDDDQLNLIERTRKKTSGGRPAGVSALAQANQSLYTSNPMYRRAAQNYEVRGATGLDPRYANYSMQMSQSGRAWAPYDYGQARQAALAWLVVVAQRDETDEALLKQLREAAEAPNADPRAVRDWFYLTSLRNEPKEFYKAGLLLARSAPNDPQCLWAFLQSVAGRTNPGASAGLLRAAVPTQGNVDRTPPLPDDELDTLVASYETLRKREPEWAGAVTNSLITELKRAKRTEAEEALYREMTESANDPSSLSVALNLAASRGDIDRLIVLADKYDRALTARQPSGATMVSMALNGFTQAMGHCYENKRMPDVLRLLDHALDGLSAPERVARRAKGASASSSTFQNRQGVSISLGRNTSRFINLDFPMPGAYFDMAAIGVLRNAYEVYRQGDVLSDLTKHLEDRLKAAMRDPNYERLALAYIKWWNDEKDEALRDLTTVVESVPNDVEMKLSLAELRANRNEPLEALALVDSVEPADQKLMQRRELLALRLAVLGGNVDRARKAAERLFGLRLDANTQVQLAQQMHQLGMHELAEAVLGRARRRSGNDPNALANLMAQYQRQDRMEEALQVAYQIMRRSPQRSNQPYVVSGSIDAAQMQALQLLSRSGKLDEQIERLESQVARSPSSIGLYQTLSMYYNAAGKRDKVKEVQKKLLELRPDDAALRQQIANTAYQAQDFATAAEHYAVAIKKDPAQFGRYAYQMIQAFQRAGKRDELIALVRDLDLRAMARGQTYAITNLMMSLENDSSTRELSLEIFKKGWKSLPNSRYEMLLNSPSDEVWELPELYEYVHDYLIPKASAGPPAPWSGLDSNIMSYSRNGQSMTMLARLLQVADRQGKLDAIAAEIDEATKRWPEWYGGKGIRAIIDLRAGRTAQGAQAIAELFALLDENSPRTSSTVLALGQELENDPATQPLAERLYKETLATPTFKNDPNDMENTIARRLAELYRRTERPEEARALLLRPDRLNDEYYVNDPAYQAYRRVNASMSRGMLLLQAGFPADSLRIYNGALADTSTLNAAASMFGGQDQFSQQLRDQVQVALRALEKQEDRERTLRSLVWPVGATAPHGEALDLVLLVQPRDLRNATLISLLGDTLTGAVRTPGLFKEANDELKRLASEKPDDLSAHVALSLAAFAEGKAEGIDSALKGLITLVDRSPLEELPKGARANSRQRDVAAKWLGVWPVARLCLKNESLRPIGETLAVRAREAARRQTDAIWTQAILREWGQLALESGDKARAEAYWTELLESILVPSKTGGTAPTGGTSLAPPPPPPSVPAPAATAVMTRAVAAVRLQPAAPATAAPLAISSTSGALTTFTTVSQPQAIGTTADRFQQALEVAKLAAENGLGALSLRATRDALRGGPPITPINVEPNNLRLTRVVSVYGQNEPAQTSGPESVIQAIIPLERAWVEAKVPPADVYAVLREVVLPEARPREAFLYPSSLAASRTTSPRSVGAILATWALRANARQDLERRIEARAAEPLAELPLKVLRTLLALKADDSVSASKGLADLAARLEKDSLQNTAELACHAALPALKTPTCAEAAELVVARAIKRLNTAGQITAGGGDLSIALARHYFAKNKADAASALLDDYQKAIEELPRLPNQSFEQSAGPVKTALARVAVEYARADRLDEALLALGKFADLPVVPYNEPSIAPALQRLSYLLARLPAAERYERLRTWTLPTNDRKLVRFLACGAPTDETPAVFKAQPPQAVDGIVSTSGALIAAAREAGKLEELAEEARNAADAKVEQAGALVALVAIARGRPEEALPVIIAAREEREKRQSSPQEQTVYLNELNQTQAPRDWPEALLVQEAARVPALRNEAQLLAGRIGNTINSRAMTVLLNHARSGPDVGPQPPTDALPALWRPAPHEMAQTHPEAGQVARWVLAEDVLGHVGAPDDSCLFFAVPITGTFRIDVRTFQGLLSYGGQSIGLTPGQHYVFDGGTGNQDSLAGPGMIGPHSESVSPALPTNTSNGPTRLTIDVAPEHTRFLIDGRLIHEAKGPSSPWIALEATGGRFLDLRIDGRPEVPRVVKLLQGDDLRQWSARFFKERVKPRKDAVLRRSSRDADEEFQAIYQRRGAEPAPRVFDWEAGDGVIIGQRIDRAIGSLADDSVPSLLRFVRPLGDGDTLSYEFHYVPGAEMVHPALGRLVFQLDPDRVRAHWITDKADLDPTGLPINNVADDPAIKQGPGPLPLKADDWNEVKLALRDGSVSLSLNGRVIAERPLEPANDRLFGLFHFKDQTRVKVRATTLTGDWPATLPANLLEPAVAPDPAARLVRAAWIGDYPVIADAPHFLREIQGLPAAERHRRLVEWVLPSASHESVRIARYPVFSPEGCTFGSPVFDMIAAAREAGKLDELAEKFAAVPVKDEPQARVKMALTTLVASAQGRNDEARATLAELTKATKALPPQAPLEGRQAEMLALAGVLPNRDLLEAAAPLADALKERAKRPPDGPKTPIRRQNQPPQQGQPEPYVAPATLDALRLAFERDRLARGEALSPPSSRWLTASRDSSRAASLTSLPATWTERDHRIAHVPGQGPERLYLATPLTGDFDFQALLEGMSDDQVVVDYAGTSLQVDAEGKNAQLTTAGGAVRTIPLDPPVDPARGLLPFRMVVKGGRCQFFLADHQVVNEPIRRDASPWLFLKSAATGQGALRDVRIQGGPTVPDRVALSGPRTWTDWSGLRSPSGTNWPSFWQSQNTEVLGKQAPNASVDYETALFHSRPMADGETITYEARGEKGPSSVHPAIGGQVFLLGPEGVQLHRLTDPGTGQEDLSPGNTAELSGFDKGPLPFKEKEWDRVSLTLSGDKVSITLNGKRLGEAPLEKGAPRRFGLFRWADSPTTRVRNVEISGPWKFAE